MKKAIITETGFKCKIDEDVRDDMEFLETLTKVSRGDMTYLSDMILGILGEKGKAALYEHCRGKNGRVSSERCIKEVLDIFDKIKNDGDSELKN